MILTSPLINISPIYVKKACAKLNANANIKLYGTSETLGDNEFIYNLSLDIAHWSGCSIVEY